MSDVNKERGEWGEGGEKVAESEVADLFLFTYHVY